MAIVHLAGFTYVGESVRDPLLYYQNNISGSLCLLECAVDQGIGALVFSSSAAVYGDPLSIPIGEDHPLAPINPYGFTKVAVERFLRDAETAGDLRSISLRYFNAAGADPDGEAGEAHDPETHLIPLVLTAARTGTPLTIFGTDYDTPDGTCIRDYIHVSDLADAHVRSLQALLAGGPSMALNLGTGAGLSVRQILTTGEAVTGRKNPRPIWAPAPGRPTATRGRPGQGPARTRVDTPPFGHRNNYPYSVELDEPGMNSPLGIRSRTS